MKRSENPEIRRLFKEGLVKAKKLAEAHANDDVREEFEQCIEAGKATTTNARYEELLTALEKCTDIVPSGMCEGLEIPVGSSYADAVKHCRGILHGVRLAKDVLISTRTGSGGNA